MRLRLVSHSAGNRFMAEILEAIAHEARMLGVDAEVAADELPPLDSDVVYVIVVHEFFELTPPERHPDADFRARMIGLSVEHPGTMWFEQTAARLPLVARAFDINRSSAGELRRRGLVVEHFQLGYHSPWDLWSRDLAQVRDVDVTYLGATDPRRDSLLASYGQDLWQRRVKL
jgi:hypothetical protein